MKDKIMYLVIGALIGAIITAGCFLIFRQDNPGRGGRPDGEPGQMQEMDGNFVPGNRADGDRTPPNEENTTNSDNTTSNSTTENVS